MPHAAGFLVGTATPQMSELAIDQTTDTKLTYPVTDR